MSNIQFYNDIMALHKEVTGSCILNNIKFPDGRTKKFLVDCGLFQETEHSELNSILPFDASSIDFVIVTHNHIDHIGRLPLLVKNGFRGSIYMSKTTAKLLPHALGDSYKVLATRAKLSGMPQLYTQKDVEMTLNQVQPQDYEKNFKIGESIKVTFFMNGHLPGAIIPLVRIHCPSSGEKTYKDINLLFSGDYNSKNMFFDVNPVPSWVREMPLTMVLESTYGDMDSSEIKYVFEDNILNAISKGKDLILPVFSLGRAQEIMYVLRNLQDSGKLDKNIVIYFDGKLGMKYNSFYLKDGLDNRPECQDFVPHNFHSISGDIEMRRKIMNDGEQKIIIATGGMGSHGPAQTYIPAYLSRKNALIHFTGYCAEGTTGRSLYEAQEGDVVTVSGLQICKNADVQYTSEFSAHAKADELIHFLKSFSRPNLVLINHGESDTKEAFANRVVREINPKNVGILGSYLFRVDGYGLVKSFTTKFR